MSKSLAENWANPSSLYTPGLENAQLLNRCRATVAKTLGCTAAAAVVTVLVMRLVNRIRRKKRRRSRPGPRHGN